MTETDIEAALQASSTPLTTDQLPLYYRAWIYGEPGAGKTELAGRLIGLYNRPACLISSDSAWVTLLKPELSLGGRITKYDFEGFSQVREIAEKAARGVEPYASYDTLIWDTVSTSIDRMVANLVLHKKFPKEQKDPGLAAWAHYNLVSTALKPTIEALNKAPFNVIYLSHVRQPSEKDIEKQKFSIRPNTPEACFNQLSQEVQLVGYLYKEKAGGARVLKVEGDKNTIAKSQIFTIPEGLYAVEQIPDLIRQWRSVLETKDTSQLPTHNSFLVE